MNPSSFTPLSLEEKIEGTQRGRIVAELITNTAVFPLFNAIRAISLTGLGAYFVEFPHYLLWAAVGVQAWFLGRKAELPWWQKVLGNLIAPALYTAVDILLEGWPSFWASPSHQLYWIFSLLMASLYALMQQFPALHNSLRLLMSLARVMLFPILYATAELSTELTGLSVPRLLVYMRENNGHVFIFWAAVLFGILLGWQDIQAAQYLALLRQTAHQLRTVSEWSLAPDVLAVAVADTTYLHQARVQRAVLFMDVRGFTHWSNSKRPEEVVTMLNEFYEMSEQVLATKNGTKPHFIGDEVMTWFEDAEQAISAALALRQVVGQKLAPFGLQVGIGLHYGEVVEGLLGSHTTRNFDIIGDTVNTASRLVSAATPGEILLSDSLVETLQATQPHLPTQMRTIQVKGKDAPLRVYGI